MAKQAKINSVEIEIGDEVVTLSLAQVRELRDVLNQTFPCESSVVKVIHDYSYRPYRGPMWSAELRKSDDCLRVSMEK